MAIDLSSLDISLDDQTPATRTVEVVKEVEVIKEVSNGTPLQLAIDLVEADPNQPRKKFDAEAMKELEDSIKVTGIRSPVSVRSHPTKPNHWMLNFGERRLRASRSAGLKTIPAFIDESHDSYAQVIENLQRESLSPMELAIFISGRLKAGDKKSAVAKNLGIDAGIVTNHLALIEAPDSIESAYSQGKCTSPRTLYELRKLQEKHPEQVDAWIAATEEITRKTVAELAEDLNAPGKKGGSQSLGHDQETGSKGEGAHETGAGGNASGRGGAGEGDESSNKLPFHNPDHEKTNKEPTVADHNKIKNPVLLVSHDDRDAMVMLKKRPTTPGLIWIKYEDTGVEQEIDAGSCRISVLIESQA